jgi:DNA repair protein RadD
MMILRDYQTEAVGSIWNYFQHKSGNPLVAMPTGTGKSVVIAEFLRSIFGSYPGQRVMILTHVKELIQQNYEELLRLWPMAPAGVYSAGLGRRDTAHRILFAGIASVAKRSSEFGRIDLVLVDECHLISPNDETLYNMFFAALRKINPHLKIVGFTATAWRLGVGKIEGAGLFTDTCFDITHLNAFNRLIDEGYLLPLVPKSPKTLLDVDGVHMRGGEFVAGELQAAVDREEVTYAALTEMLEHAEGRHSWLLFCSGVEHAIHTAGMLTHLGIPCEAVHSKMPDGDRDRILRDYKSGKLKAVANNNVLTTGFNHPALDMIGMLRPTASPVLWVQMLGRGTRPMYAPGFDLTTLGGRLQSISVSQKKNCLVMDFAGNTRRLGPINDPVIPRKKGEKGGEAPVKLCESCNTWCHASARVCFNCGAPFLQSVKIVHSASTDVLIRGADFPVVEVFKVDHATYEVHRKPGKPDMLRITYYCGMRRFSEFACFDHDGFAKRKANQWWRERSKSPVPNSTLEAINNTDLLKVATHLRIHLKKPYDEILAHCYDGSGFGADPVSDDEVPTETHLNVVTRTSFAPKKDKDDDIPFGPSVTHKPIPRAYNRMDDDIPF